MNFSTHVPADIGRKPQKGFTLIELLIVLVILSLIITILIVILRPGEQFSKARNVQRQAETQSILSAISFYQLQNGKNISTIEQLKIGLVYMIGTATANCKTSCTFAGTTEEACVDLKELVLGEFLYEVPVDPDESRWDDSKTGYYLKRQSKSIIAGACMTESLDGEEKKIEGAR